MVTSQSIVEGRPSADVQLQRGAVMASHVDQRSGPWAWLTKHITRKLLSADYRVGNWTSSEGGLVGRGMSPPKEFTPSGDSRINEEAGRHGREGKAAAVGARERETESEGAGHVCTTSAQHQPGVEPPALHVLITQVVLHLAEVKVLTSSPAVD